MKSFGDHNNGVRGGRIGCDESGERTTGLARGAAGCRARRSSQQQGDWGLQVEVLEAIAKSAGFKVAFTITENTRKSFGLMDEGKLDAVAGTTVTAENQAKYSFTVGYGTTAEALVVPKTDKQQYVTIADARALDHCDAARLALCRVSKTEWHNQLQGSRDYD
jgi:hypothetical protein